MPADLHVHTNCSDGTMSPEDVVELAHKINLKTIAITDHDVVDGIEPAKERGQGVGVDVIPGIEMTTELGKIEIHILGYYLNHNNPNLIDSLNKIQKGREERIYKICDKLKGLGISVDPAKVFIEAGHLAAGRPHVARVMVKEGLVASFKEAFDRYLDSSGPAYVSHYKLLPAEAIQLILSAGGIPVLAHPRIMESDHVIPDLVGEGLLGIEVYYPGYNASQIERYLTLARKLGLLVTGGSDFHGTKSGRDVDLGFVTVSDELVDNLKNEHLRRN
ncbi:MAG: PHP domain-containing protein [Candidatus Margulisiibacteriota bacterium]